MGSRFSIGSGRGSNVDEQHRELMAPQTQESDIDLACRLQLEEALAASLSVLPSSSSSPPSQILAPPADVVSPSFVSLQSDKFSKFQRELKESRIRRSHLSKDPCVGQAGEYTPMASSSAGTSHSKLFYQFVGMGFSEKLVAKVIDDIGEEKPDAILEFLLTYKVLENSPQEQDVDEPAVVVREVVDRDNFSSDYEGSSLDDLSDEDSYSGSEDVINPSPEEKKLLLMTDMGCRKEEAHIAIETCVCVQLNHDNPWEDKEDNLFLPLDDPLDVGGLDASVEELTDFICAVRMSKEADALRGPEEKPRLLNDYRKHRKRKHTNCDAWSKKRRGEKKLLHGDEEKIRLPNPTIGFGVPTDSRGIVHRTLPEVAIGLRGKKKLLHGDDEQIRFPNPMIGFGVPTDSRGIVHRTLPEVAAGLPYFYYENVARAPKGVWDTISRFLYNVEPEFVDSKYFCAAAGKRGYVHNLPTNNRFPLLPLPPRTIQEALPLTKNWWPSWDTRTKLNSLKTCIGSAKLTERIRKALEDYDGDSEPPLRIQKYVLDECRKWNLVWVGRNKLAPLEPDEVEMLLGFPKNHTRGGGIIRTDRYKSLGNSFQVDTVAYHLSVLKGMFPAGINLLSLFSGIGGAEVALHRLGIPLKNVVSVGISEVNRNIVRSWWEQTNQKGKLIHIADVRRLNGDRLEQLMNSFGGFDLVVGGSPGNNLAGSNRHSRDGLGGKESSLFYDYFRILGLVKWIMSKGQR